MCNFFKCVASFFSTLFIYLLGGFDVALQSLIVVMVLDYITGISKGYVNKNLNSSMGFKGVIKKLCFLCLVALSVMIDNLLGDSGYIRTLIIYYLVANEGLSILENLGEMDIIVPEFLKERLEQLKGKEVE